MTGVASADSLDYSVRAPDPTGFEHLCNWLLTELGLALLRTVGQASDRGIDVEDHHRVNPVVTFRVGVQCKRYADGNPVTPRQVRELQGALGPFDRGIFITTSVFTQPKAPPCVVERGTDRRSGATPPLAGPPACSGRSDVDCGPQHRFTKPRGVCRAVRAPVGARGRRSASTAAERS